MKKDKRHKKMSPEEVQGLMAMRRRTYVQKNGKAYTRNKKHKNKED